MLDSHSSISAMGEVFLFGRSRFLLLPKTGQEIAGSYRNFLAASAARRLQDLVNRSSVVEVFLDNLYAQSEGRAVGFKFMRSHTRRFPSVVPYLLENGVPAIHVVRENVLKTLISRETARRRKLFHASSKVPTTKIEIDVGGLVGLLQGIATDNTDWARIFSGSPYLRVSYEDFVADRQREFQRICEFLKVDSKEDFASHLVKINPDGIEQVVENYEEVCRTLKGTPFEYCLQTG